MDEKIEQIFRHVADSQPPINEPEPAPPEQPDDVVAYLYFQVGPDPTEQARNRLERHRQIMRDAGVDNMQQFAAKKVRDVPGASIVFPRFIGKPTARPVPESERHDRAQAAPAIVAIKSALIEFARQLNMTAKLVDDLVACGCPDCMGQKFSDIRDRYESEFITICELAYWLKRYAK